MTYPAGFNPYEWHDGKKGQWRVKQGMADLRLRCLELLDAISERMETRESFRLVDQWSEVKQMVLDCEETR